MFSTYSTCQSILPTDRAKSHQVLLRNGRSSARHTSSRYTIPYLFTEDDNGMEDMRLNYRLQAFMEDKYTPAFAPRFSLVLPTGDSDKGFGAGVVGYEFNLPFSKIVSDRWTLNFNAGMSVFPNAHQSRHLTNYKRRCERHLRCQPGFQSHARNACGLE